MIFLILKAVLIELSDYLRNKSYDANTRKLFRIDSKGNNELDMFALRFTSLNALMQNVIISYDKLKQTALELKKMSENFIYAQNIIDRNQWDRKLKPNHEREEYRQTEISINKVNIYSVFF